MSFRHIMTILTIVMCSALSGAGQQQTAAVENRNPAGVYVAACKQFGVAVIDLAYAADNIATMHRVNGYSAGKISAPSIQAAENEYSKLAKGADDLTKDGRKVYRLVWNPGYATSPEFTPPYNPEEIAIRNSPERLLSLAQDFSGKADRYLTEVRALLSSTESTLKQLGVNSSGKYTPGNPPSVNSKEIMGNLCDRFLIAPYSPEGTAPHEHQGAPLMDRIADFVSQAEIRPWQSANGYDDETDLTPKMCRNRPAEVILLPGGMSLFMPKWFNDAHKGDSNFFMWKYENKGGDPSFYTWPPVYDIFNREVRSARYEWIGNVARHFSTHPQVLFYKSFWEPGLSDGWALQSKAIGGYTLAAKSAFRDYLKQKYKTVDAMNKALGVSYSDFSLVEPPSKQAFEISDKDNPSYAPLTPDFRAFRYDVYTDFVRGTYEAIKRNDPSRPVAFDGSASLVPMYHDAQDYWEIFKYCDIFSLHFWYNDPAEDVLLYSINRYYHKTLGNLEYYWNCGPETWAKYDNEELSAAVSMRNLWQLSAYGRSMFNIYGARDTFGSKDGRPYSGDCYMDFYSGFTILRRSGGSLHVMYDKLQRVSQVLRALDITTPKVAVLYPSSTMRNVRDPFAEKGLLQHYKTVFDILYSNNYHYAYVPEQAFLEGKDSLTNYKVLILPMCSYLPRKLSRDIEAWVRKGGALVITGDMPGVYDESASQDGCLPKALFGTSAITFTKAGSFKWVGEDLGRGKVDIYGKGVVYALISSPDGPEKQALSTNLCQLIDRNYPRQAWSEQGSVKVVLRKDAKFFKGSVYLTVWNLSASEEQKARLHVKGVYSNARDLTCDYDFSPSYDAGDTILNLCLFPGQGTVIKLTK